MTHDDNSYYLPASSPHTVHAIGRRMGIRDYLRVAGHIGEEASTSAEFDEAMNHLHLRVETNLQRHATKIRTNLPPNKVQRFTDLDSMQSHPDTIVRSPFGFWIVGMLDSLSAILSSLALARMSYRDPKQAHAQLMQLLSAHEREVEAAWRVEVDALNLSHPWLHADLDSIDLVGISEEKPRFRIQRKPAPRAQEH